MEPAEQRKALHALKPAVTDPTNRTGSVVRTMEPYARVGPRALESEGPTRTEALCPVTSEVQAFLVAVLEPLRRRAAKCAF